MRGGLVVCIGDPDAVSARLRRVASRLRWHHGRAEEHVLGRLTAILFVDDGHGPALEQRRDRAVISHGGLPQPLSELHLGSSRFAALEWDGRALRASRDPLGEVPLFYYHSVDAVWFATEILPLATLGPAVPDLEAITATASALPLPERTGWEGVLRVLPGEVVEVDPALTTRRWRYWHPSSLFGGFLASREEATAGFRSRFEDSVQRTLGARTGVLLSGGLDSSSIAVVAPSVSSPRAAEQGCITLLGCGYPSLPGIDERRYAEAVAGHAGLPLHWIAGRLDRWDPRTELNAFGAPGISLPTGVLDTALPALAAQGCDVVLDGHDGDGVLGHRYADHAMALLDLRIPLLLTSARQVGRTAVLRTLASEFVPPALRFRRLRGHRPVRDEIERLLPYFRGQVRQRFLTEFRWRPPRSGWRQQQLRCLLPPATQHLEELEIEGARFGIDLRHPFADRELVEFLVSLPHSVKASPVRSKTILRDAFADLLPALVRDRMSKTEFSPVLDRRVDYAACRAAIAESGVRLPDVDYDHLFRESDPPRDRCAWIRLARAHVFAAGAVP